MIRNDVEVVETTRQRLGPVGVWLAAAQAAIDRERQAARRIEELGYGSIWTPEGLAGQGSLRTPIAVVGGDRADRDRHRDSQRVGPATMQGGAATPGAAYPGRFVLGVGISHAPMVEGSGQAYEKPLALAPISGIVVRYNAATASVCIRQPSTWLHEPAVHFESQR